MRPIPLVPQLGLLPLGMPVGVFDIAAADAVILVFIRLQSRVDANGANSCSLAERLSLNSFGPFSP